MGVHGLPEGAHQAGPGRTHVGVAIRHGFPVSMSPICLASPNLRPDRLSEPRHGEIVPVFRLRRLQDSTDLLQPGSGSREGEMRNRAAANAGRTIPARPRRPSGRKRIPPRRPGWRRSVSCHGRPRLAMMAVPVMRTTGRRKAVGTTSDPRPRPGADWSDLAEWNIRSRQRMPAGPDG